MYVKVKPKCNPLMEMITEIPVRTAVLCNSVLEIAFGLLQSSNLFLLQLPL